MGGVVPLGRAVGARLTGHGRVSVVTRLDSLTSLSLSLSLSLLLSGWLQVDKKTGGLWWRCSATGQQQRPAGQPNWTGRRRKKNKSNCTNNKPESIMISTGQEQQQQLSKSSKSPAELFYLQMMIPARDCGTSSNEITTDNNSSNN